MIREKYDAIVADYRTFATSIGIKNFLAMPISGLAGDNITSRSANTPWYQGPTLIEHLETVEIDADVDQAKPFRMPVQWVNRPNLDFRGIFRADRQRDGKAGRPDPCGTVRQDLDGESNRHFRWRC